MKKKHLKIIDLLFYIIKWKGPYSLHYYNSNKNNNNFNENNKKTNSNNIL